jgi:hypothetical protein
MAALPTPATHAKRPAAGLRAPGGLSHDREGFGTAFRTKAFAIM